MKIVCSWCGEYIGLKEPLENKSITHSICKECFVKEMEVVMSIS